MSGEKDIGDHLDRLIAYTGSPDVYYAPSIDELRCAIAEIQAYREVKAAIQNALREAFDAGVQQGNAEAVAYEWGSFPDFTSEQAFKEALEPYNGGSIANVLALIERARQSNG